ncbi:autotransporter family protein [Rubripirellula lacrimiformis]|nr:autotransporter outer membrane beta-barrel domain-containing protein [Rubripirellula lacrimiformis]
MPNCRSTTTTSIHRTAATRRTLRRSLLALLICSAASSASAADVTYDDTQSISGNDGHVTVNDGGKVTNHFESIYTTPFIYRGALYTLTHIDGATVNGGTLTNQGYIIEGVVVNGGTLTNNYRIVGSATVTGGTLTNNDEITGQAIVSGGTLTNGSEIGSGANITGGTLTNNGEIFYAPTLVGANGRLAGTGYSLSVQNSGTHAIGNSIGTYAADSYQAQAGSILDIEIQPSSGAPAAPVAGTDNDYLDVSGTIDIDPNARVKVSLLPGANANDLALGAKYTFLKAGTINGQFNANVIEDLAFFDVELNWQTTTPGDDFYSFSLIEAPARFAEFDNSSNNRSLGSVLDTITGTGDMADVLGQARMFSGSQVSSFISQVGGSSFGSNNQIAVQGTSLMTQTIAGQIRAQLFNGSGSAMGPGPMMAQSSSPRDASPIELVSYVDVGPAAYSSRQAVMQTRTEWQGWVLGYGLDGSADSNGGVSGIHYGLGGVTAGIQRSVDDTHSIGFFGGYVGSNATGQTSDFSSQTDGGQFGSFVTGNDGRNYYVLMGGLQFEGYDSSRTINVGGINRTAEADYSGWQGFTYLERGLTLHSGKNTVWQPYGGLQYVYVNQDGFTESGAGALNLQVDSLDTHSLRSMLGTRVRRTLGDHGWQHFVTPEVRVAWMHEFLDTSTLVNSQFAGVGGSGFTNSGLDLGRDWVLAGAGLSFQLTDRFDTRVDYNTQVNAHQDLHIGSGQINYRW